MELGSCACHSEASRVCLPGRRAMGRSDKARQRSVERHAAKRKLKKRAVGSVTGATPRAVLRLATRWPVHECLISRDWNKEGELVQIVVARRSPEGQIATGVFLVD